VENDVGRFVLCRTQNRTVSNLHFATFRLVPYHARSHSSIPVTRLVVDRDDLVRINV